MRHLLILPLGLLLGACADAPKESTGVSSSPLIGGTADAHDPSVVMILSRSSPTATDVRLLCTGTIVSPHVVLTAAHCVDPRVTGSGQLGVFTGSDIDDPTQANDPKRFFTAKGSMFDPAFDPANVPPAGGDDIGVIVVRTPLPGTPVPINRDALGQDAAGSQVRLVGAGKTDPSTDSSGKVFELRSAITSVDDAHLVFDGSMGTLCGGDSGGPTLLERSGKEVVVGVHSYGEHATSCTGRSYDERVDVHAASFVDAQMKAADPDFQPENVSPMPASGDPNDAGAEAEPPAVAAASPTTTTKSGCAVGHGAPGREAATALAVLGVALLARRRLTSRASCSPRASVRASSPPSAPRRCSRGAWWRRADR
jgi:hypothetical protein